MIGADGKQRKTPKMFCQKLVAQEVTKWWIIRNAFKRFVNIVFESFSSLFLFVLSGSLEELVY